MMTLYPKYKRRNSPVFSPYCTCKSTGEKLLKYQENSHWVIISWIRCWSLLGLKWWIEMAVTKEWKQQPSKKQAFLEIKEPRITNFSLPSFSGRFPQQLVVNFGTNAIVFIHVFSETKFFGHCFSVASEKKPVTRTECQGEHWTLIDFYCFH